MAVLWSKKTEQTTYEVRSAGQTVRLYSNGVLHSQYNPTQVISGAIWDLLLLPGFCLNQPPKSVLVLGLGGGTLVHLIRHFFPEASITCVELDAEHIRIAKRWFKIPTKNVSLVHGDAYEYLQSNKERFDWIVDDVFQHVTGDPQRGFPIQRAYELYLRNISDNGILSLNLIGQQQRKQAKHLLLQSKFDLGLQFSHPLYDNRILCLMADSGLEKAMIAKQIKNRMNQHKLLDQTRRTCRLKYKMQWLNVDK